TVICATSCLKRDISTSTTIMVSVSAPDSAGRRNSAIQTKFSAPQAKRKHRREPKSVSVWNIRNIAARWGAATASDRQMPIEARPEVATAERGPGSGAEAIGNAELCPALPEP